MGEPRRVDIRSLDAREQGQILHAARLLGAIPAGGPPAAVFQALRSCAPVSGGMIGVMGSGTSGSMLSHVVGLPTEVLEGWATTPIAHLHRMMAPLVPASPGELISDRAAITGSFREELELLRVMRSAGLGESAGYKVAARTSLTGKPEHRFLTVALEGPEVFTPRERELFHLLQPEVDAALARMAVPIVASEPIFAQVVEERRLGYLCVSRRRAIVELNERAHELVFRYLHAARVEPGRGFLDRFADRALIEAAGGRAWRLFRPGAAVEVSVHRLAKEMHHAGEDVTLVMMTETEIEPAPELLSVPGLTARQIDVAHLLVTTDLSYKEIAVRLGVAEGTVRKHVERVYRAFGVRSRAGMAFKLR